MGFFFRKSTKIGPFRINFSKSGIGLSTGIKGARVSVGPNGTFVHLGRNGMYYRKKISFSNKKNNFIEEVNLEQLYSISNNETAIETKNFDGITDVDSQDFIDNLQKQDRKIFLYKWFGVLPLCIYLLYLMISWASNINEYGNEAELFKINKSAANIRADKSMKAAVIKVASKDDEFEILDKSSNWYEIQLDNSVAYVHNSVGEVINNVVENEVVASDASNYSWLPILFFIAIIILLYRYDKKRKRIDIFYSMDEDFIDIYDYQKQFFAEFQANSKIWQKKTTERVTNSKYHGGAKGF